MPWSAEIAMLDMWREMVDKNVTNGEMQKFFKKHLQLSYDAGSREERESCAKIVEADGATMVGRRIAAAIRYR